MAAALTAPATLAARRLLVVVLAACALLTLGGYLLKAQCIGDYDAVRDKVLCSNDVQVLFDGRGLAQHRFPYVHGGLDAQGQITGGTVEYPVLTGVFTWVASLPVTDDGDYLRVTALLLAPFSLLSAYLLLGMVRWRALVYALAPPLVWYSFHNWDLLVVCATVAAFHAWWRGSSARSAVWLAVGASLKLWPGLFLLPLVLARLKAGDRRGAGLVLLAFGGTYAAANVPFLVANPDGWYAPYGFQTLRAADITANSLWFWAFSTPPSVSTLNHVIPVLLAAAVAGACAWGWTRDRFPYVQVSGAALCAFMVLNKAHSPQYALWLLPFFCLLRVRWGWWAAYFAVDACTYVGVFRWYYALSQGRDFGLAKQALVIGVWGRAVLLVLLFVLFLRSDLATVTEPVEEPVREPVRVPVAA